MFARFFFAFFGKDVVRSMARNDHPEPGDTITGPKDRNQVNLGFDNDAARLRVIIDQVASLTDASAVTWHHALLNR